MFLLAAYTGWLLDDVLFPGYRSQKVRQPVFIIGNPRSGTTLLHRLMTKDQQNFCYFQTWELGFAPTVTQRKAIQAIGALDRLVGSPLQRLVATLDKRTLGMVDLHPMGLQKAEEDDLILLYAWNSTFIMAIFPYPEEVLPRILPFDQLPEERRRVMSFYKGCVKRHLHAHQAGEKRLLSKNPVFSSRIDALYETFPDAKFIYLIRNPLNVLPSLASYTRAVWEDFQGAAAEFPYYDHVWNAVWMWYRYTLERLEQAPPESYIVVRFDDLVKDPRQTVSDVYEHFGFELEPEFEGILKQETKKARRYESKHTYSLEEMGVTRGQVLAEYQDLIERFGFDAGD